MAFWKDRPASHENIWLFVLDDGWKGSSDKLGDDEKVEALGSRRLIESAFLNALNLVLLTGTGASFAARNPRKLPENYRPPE